MPRVREIKLDNLSFKIAPLSWDEAEAYIKEGKEMLSRVPVPQMEEWTTRTLQTVANALNRGSGATNGNGWNADKLKAELDMVTIQELHTECMKMTGLFTVSGTQAGEAPATSISS
ncbi:MAG: hypothetical protein ACHP6J_04570 [Burkholderiales bacterium]